MSFLTVLTPIYNRQKHIPSLFRSLLDQTDHRFQWLVIDDGSSEPVLDTIKDLAKDAPFSVDCYYKENGGKHTALNFSHPYIKGDWVLILDSDDTLCENAVEAFYQYADKYSHDQSIGVFSFQKGLAHDKSLVCFDSDATLSDHITYRINGKRDGDCCEIIRTSAMKEFPFPVFEGERYMSESHLWLRTADNYKTLYIPKVIYLCQYLEDGLTKQGRSYRRKCPKGCMYTNTLGLNKRCCFSYRVKRALLIHYYGRVQGLKSKAICRSCEQRTFLRLFSIPGFFLYHIWERKYKSSP